MNTHPDVPQMLFFDQDLLAIVYKDKWTPLAYTYNALKPMRACHCQLWKGEDVKILHYILDKPWKKRTWDWSDVVEVTHGLWWKEFEELEGEWIGVQKQRAGGVAEPKWSGRSSKYELVQGEDADANKQRLWEAVVVPFVARE